MDKTSKHRIIDIIIGLLESCDDCEDLKLVLIFAETYLRKRKAVKA